MAKKFDELRKKMSPARRRRNESDARRLLAEMSLRDLRRKLGSLTQEDVAALLDVTQGYVSKLERQGDMLLSKLYAYVEALGGELQIRAKFAHDEVVITQFEDASKLAAALSPKSRAGRSA